MNEGIPLIARLCFKSSRIHWSSRASFCRDNTDSGRPEKLGFTGVLLIVLLLLHSF